MRALPSIMLIAAGTATAVLSTACLPGSDGGPSGPGPDPPPMFTTIDGVVWLVDPLRMDSIPAPRVVVLAFKRLSTITPDFDLNTRRTQLDITTTGPNGEYHLEFTASCEQNPHSGTLEPRYSLVVESHRMLSGSISNVVCTVPNIRVDIGLLRD